MPCSKWDIISSLVYYLRQSEINRTNTFLKTLLLTAKIFSCANYIKIVPQRIMTTLFNFLISKGSPQSQKERGREITDN